MGEARQVADAYFGALDRGDVEAATQQFHPDAEFVSPAARMRGREEIRPFLEGFAAAIPDAQFEVARAIEAGSSVALEGVYSGTHTGPLAMPDGTEIPATGQRISAPFVTLFDVERGAISSHRAYWDVAGFMAQLGLMPAAG